MVITCKFGGTSLSCSENIRRCCDIVKTNKDRKYVVVQAPRKKDAKSKKVTDLLLECHAKRFETEAFETAFSQIKETFVEIAKLVTDFPIE